MNRSKANQKPNPGTSAAAAIFIIDDEPMLLELAVMLLAPAGYHLRVFRSAEDAFAAFVEGQTRPDLIITDYAMQEMTGMDLIKKCREIRPEQKVILVSGTVDERVYLRASSNPTGSWPNLIPADSSTGWSMSC